MSEESNIKPIPEESAEDVIFVEEFASAPHRTRKDLQSPSVSSTSELSTSELSTSELSTSESSTSESSTEDSEPFKQEMEIIEEEDVEVDIEVDVEEEDIEVDVEGEDVDVEDEDMEVDVEGMDTEDSDSPSTDDQQNSPVSVAVIDEAFCNSQMDIVLNEQGMGNQNFDSSYVFSLDDLQSRLNSGVGISAELSHILEVLGQALDNPAVAPMVLYNHFDETYGLVLRYLVFGNEVEDTHGALQLAVGNFTQEEMNVMEEMYLLPPPIPWPEIVDELFSEQPFDLISSTFTADERKIIDELVNIVDSL